MVDDWILDVLRDLRHIALKNGLSVTEEQITQTINAVTGELDARHREAHGTAHVGHAREFSQPVERSHNA